MTGDEFEDGSVTAGGSRIIVGKERQTGWTPPEGYAENIEHIQAHLEPVFGESSSVFHEIISDLIHLDVLVYPPDDRRDYWVYVTSGMGDIRMSLPDDLSARELGRAELMIALPRAWGDKVAKLNTDKHDQYSENVFWPISLMKWLARYPHEAGTWFADGHTIPNGPDAEPYSPESRLNGALIAYSTLLPPDRASLVLPEGDWLNFYGVTLLYPEEMDFKLNKGVDGLAQRFDRAGVSEVVDLNRRSVVKTNPLLRLLGGR